MQIFTDNMSKILFTNIKQLNGILPKDTQLLKGKELQTIHSISNAYLLIEDDKIAEFGKMSDCPTGTFEQTIDLKGQMILPAWCDSHTHLVFASPREEEFVDRIKGLSYEEIAKKGGGILNSAKKLENTSEEQLFNDALVRLYEIARLGTGAVEIKSGYGLSLEGELKMLRVIKRLKKVSPLIIKATFLGAHAIPAKYKDNREDYINLIINEILPIIKKENLADYIDVFCETNYFTPKETDRILKAGAEIGLQPKIHVNQFTSIGGIQTGIENKALSVDHLEIMTEDDIKNLKSSNTIPTLLPSCSFFLSLPYAPAKKLIDNGLPIALATDFNPGSTPSGNMNFVISLACIKMKILPETAINAGTINGAYAMGISDIAGSITKGKKANFIITKPIKSLALLPYFFGHNQIDKVYINGTLINPNQ